MVIKVTGKEKEVYDTSDGPRDSLGMLLKTSEMDLKQKKSLFVSMSSYAKDNRPVSLAFIFSTLVFIYAMAFYNKLVFFHYISCAFSIFFMMWISLAEDARKLFKYVSIVLIFVGIIIYISL